MSCSGSVRRPGVEREIRRSPAESGASGRAARGARIVEVMRTLAALLALSAASAACTGCSALRAGGVPGAAPEALPSPADPPLADIAPQLPAGEETVWNVFYQGVHVGRVDQIVGAESVRSQFDTGRLASLFGSGHLELATSLEGGHVRAVREVLTQGRAVTRTEAAIDGAWYTPLDAPEGEALPVPGATRLHTVHSALGAVRAWSARPGPLPGYLWLWSGGQLYRLDVARPERDEALGLRALRVDGTVRAPHLPDPIELSLWLAANADRTPVRLSLSSGPHRVAAEVAESTASLVAR